jgi:hypothetical protein
MPLSKIRPPSSLNKPKSPQSNTTKMLVVSIAAFVGFYFYYYRPLDKVSDPKETSPSNPAAQKKETSFPLPQFSSDELKLQSQSNDCSQFGDLCEKLEELKPPAKFSISSKGENYFVTFNYPDFLSGLDSKFFNKIVEEERIEYALGYLAFNPMIQKAIKEKLGSTLTIIGIYPVGNLLSLRYSMTLSLKEFAGMGFDAYQFYFSSLFYGGISRPYKKNLRQFTKFIKY